MPWQPYPAAVIDEIRTLAARGLSLREIARTMQTANMGFSTVCLLMRKHGIKRAPTKFTPEEIAWLKQHLGKPRELTQARFEKRFGRRLSRWYWRRETRRLMREEVKQ
jgi:hypothetical protein